MTQHETLDILTKYRERIKFQYEKPAWNKWALFGGLATLVWLLINLIENSQLEKEDSFKLLIALVFFDIIIYQIETVINRGSKIFKITYLEFKREFSNRPLTFIFISLLFVSIIIYSHEYIPFTNTYAFIYYGFIYLSLVRILPTPLLGIMSSPFPKGQIKAKRARRIKNLFILFMFLICMCSIWVLLLKIENWEDYKMWKSSFVFIGLYFVIRKIIEAYQKNPLVDEIDFQIDEVTFNKMSHEAAIANLKLIVQGLKIRNAVSPLLIEYFSVMKATRKKINYINDLVFRIKEEKEEVQKKKLLEELNSYSDHCKKNEHVTLTELTRRVYHRSEVNKALKHSKDAMVSTIDHLRDSLKDLNRQMEAAFDSVSDPNFR